jgi:hypothetical protein
MTVIMWREDEYRRLADSTRRRGYVEQNVLRAQWEILDWEILAATYRVDAAANALRVSARRVTENRHKGTEQDQPPERMPQAS